MKLIAIETEGQPQAEFTVGALEDARAAGRVSYEDVAVAHHTSSGTEVTGHSKGGVSRMFGHGIDNGRVERVCAKLPDDSWYVFVQGEEGIVEEVALRARTITGGGMRTFDVEGDELKETTGQAATYALDDTESALLEDTSGAFKESNLPKGRMSRP
jgi:hypothetical protein